MGDIVRFRMIVLIGSLVLCGCTVFNPEPIDAPAAMRAFEARTLDDPDLQRFVASHLSVRQTHDVTEWDLESLTLAAYYYSPQLDLAAADGALADAAVKTAAQRPNPTLRLPLQYRIDAKPGAIPYEIGLGLDLPIETAGKRDHRIEKARQLSIAAQFEISAAVWQLRSRLRTNLLGMYVARRREQLLALQVQSCEQVTQLLDARLVPGVASALEAQRAHAALFHARLDVAQARRLYQDAEADAAATIGLPLMALQKAGLRLDAFDTVTATLSTKDVREQAVLNRADVQGALAAYDASQAALQLAVANQYPDIHLGPGFTYDEGAHKFSLPTSGIALPLFNRNEGPIAEASALRKQAAARFNAVQAHALGQADRAVEHYRAATEALRLADSHLALQRQLSASVRAAFAADPTDRQHVAPSDLAERNAELARIDALAQLQLAVGELEDAMQRPLSSIDGERH